MQQNIFRQIKNLDNFSFFTFIKFNVFQVLKNRYDGQLGKFIIKFDKNTLCFKTKDIYPDEMEKNEETINIDSKLYETTKKKISAEA